MRAWLGLLLAGCSLPASAAIVTFEFTGEVLNVNPTFASIVEVGSLAAGTFSYDTAAVDEDASPTRGLYPGAMLSFTIGSYSYTGAAQAIVYDDPTFDAFQIAGTTAGADPIDGLPLQQVTLAIIAGPELYDSDALPEAPPPLDHPLVQPSQLQLGVLPPASGTTYQYAELRTVPEAGAGGGALAAAAGLLGLGLARARPARAADQRG